MDNRARTGVAIFFFVAAVGFAAVGIVQFMNCLHFRDEKCLPVLIGWGIPTVVCLVIGYAFYPSKGGRR